MPTTLFSAAFNGTNGTTFQSYTPETGSAFTRSGGSGPDAALNGSGQLLFNGGSRSDYDNTLSFRDGTVDFSWQRANSGDTVGIRLRKQAGGAAYCVGLSDAGTTLYYFDGSGYTQIGGTATFTVGVESPVNWRVTISGTAPPTITITNVTSGTTLITWTDSSNRITTAGSTRLEFNGTVLMDNLVFVDTASGGGTTSVSNDLALSYSIGASTSPVSNDLALSYSILGSSATLTVPMVNNTNTALASVTIPHVTVTKLSDRTQALSLASQTTNGSGQLVITSTSIVAGTDYIVSCWNADGSSVGIAKGTAA